MTYDEGKRAGLLRAADIVLDVAGDNGTTDLVIAAIRAEAEAEPVAGDVGERARELWRQACEAVPGVPYEPARMVKAANHAIETALQSADDLRARIAELENIVDEASLARDEAGFLGSIADAIRSFSQENRAAEAKNARLCETLEKIKSGEAFREQRFAEDDDADYFLRAQRSVQRLAAEALTQEEAK